MHPRKYSQIERALEILDKSSIVDILKDDQYLLFLFKKTERIVAALYVITGLFPDQEPLKWDMRESGSALLRHMLSLKERASVHSRETRSDTVSEVAHLLSLIDISHIADLISPMNFSILKKELDSVLNIMEGKWRIGSAPFSPPFFAESFFGISKELFPQSGIREETSGSRAEHSEDVSLHSLVEFERQKQKDTVVKDIDKGHAIRNNVLYKRSKVPTDNTDVRPTRPRKEVSHVISDAIKNDRKKRVFSVLRERRIATIKDFAAVITDCSEKTIQRLLIELVQTNVLKREGDRRWSKYSFSVSSEQVAG